MSVILKGMDAPKCCFGCIYRSEINGLHSRCSITNQIILQDEYNKVADDCPIKSLDGLINEIENAEIRGHVRDEECFNRGVNFALNIIKKYCEVENDK